MARDSVAEVRERTDAVDLVSQYVSLKRTGRNYKGLCPFHQEKTPSFVVFPESGNFHCFGCGKGGDIFTFYMGVENADFKESLAELARRAGVQLEMTPTDAPEVDAHRQRLIDLNGTAATFFNNILINSTLGAAGREAVEHRGLSADVIARFQLGFAPDGWDHLLNYLSARGVDPAFAAEAGPLQTRDTGGYYDRFRNRLIFPIRNRDGAVVGFGGRALGDAVPKYLNSPRSPIFDKSALLYGLDLAKDEIRRRDQVVIVEGYMDAIAAHQFGHPNVVAAMGTAVTEQQIALVKRSTKHIVLALDADTAGQMATLRGLETAQGTLDHDLVPIPDARGVIHWERKLNAEITIVNLPEGKDPDELIRRSPERWPEIIASAQPFLDFFLDAVTADVRLDDARGKAEAVRRAGPVLQQIADRVIQSHYVAQLARILRIDERVVSSEIRRSSMKTSMSTPDPSRSTRRQLAASHEDHLMAILLKHRSLCGDVIAMVPEGDLLDGRNRELLAVLRDQTILDLSAEVILDGLDEPLAEHGQRLLSLIDGTPAQLPGQVTREARQAVERLGRERFLFLMRQLQEEIRAAQSDQDSAAMTELSAQMQRLAERHGAFNPPLSPYFRDSRDSLATTGRQPA
ncbi:MAG: DNA primase [Thermomicrobiales bacterium]